MSEANRMSYWVSPAPEKCDLSEVFGLNHDSIAEVGEFYDGRTKMGPWANMCPRCFKRFGSGLGTGRGQRYTLQADGRWLKTGG